MGARVSKIGGRTATAFALTALGIGALSGTALGQPAPPTAEASTSCDGEEGFIDVAIIDDFSTTYDVYIDDELVDEDVTDSDEGVYTYGPYEDGDYNVRVYWISGEEDILDVDVTVDCVPDETSSTTTTAAPTTTTTAAAAAAAVQPRFTG